jgi:hypothetical protein
MKAILGRRRVVVPAIAALAVLGLATLGDLDPGGWMVIDRALNHWTCAGGVAGVLLIVALAGIRPRTWWGRSPVIIVGVVLTLATVGWVFLSHVIPLDMRVQQQTAAPGGHRYRLVIAQESDLMNPIWTLAIRTGSGISARRWQFGCLYGDDADYGLTSAGWDGPTRVVVMIGNHEPRRVVVPIDPATGRPEGAANTWNGCND